MLKTQYPANHLKEGVDSKVTELYDEMQYIEQAREFSQLKRYRRSDVDSESGSQIEKIDVPGDGSCLFWSVTMAYLMPVRNDDALFRQRYEVLFGNEGAVIQNLDRIRNLVRNLSTANYDDTFANLVRNVFRNRVVDYIRDHENEFRDFVEGNFESYLKNMRNPNNWGGEPEIRAMSGILSATISVSGEADTQYGNGNIQIQLFHVGAQGNRNHYNFGLERNIISNNKELARGLKKVMGKGRPQDFELIQLLIEEAGTEIETSKQEEDFRSFEPRFQSFVDQIPSYLHSVEKAGFFTHFFLGSFSTLLDTEVAEKLNIKKIYFSFDTSKTLKVAIVKNGQIGNAEDAINNIDLFSISEGKRGHQFTVDELEDILRNNIDRGRIGNRNVENEILNIKNEIQDRIKSRLVQIHKGKDGIFVDMEAKGILDSATSKEFHEVEKGIWNNPEGDIAKLSDSDAQTVSMSLKKVLEKINNVHSEYVGSVVYDNSAREAAHHGFMVGVFMNFRYRYNLRVYPEQFAGRGYADIILLARGPDRALDSIPIIIELKAGEGPNATPDKALQQAEKYAQGFQPNVQRVLTTADNILCVGVNLDNPSPISDIKVSNRGEEIIPLFQDILESTKDWDTQTIGRRELKEQVKDNLERIYHTFPGTSEKGDNHYFSRFLLGQSLLLSEDSGTSLKKYIFIYRDNIPTEVHPNLRGLGRLAAQRSREALSTNLDESHAVVTMVLIPENTGKLVYVINIVEANRKDVLNGLNEELPLDRLNREIGNREIVELNLNFDTRYKSDFKRYLTVWTEKYNSLQEYNNGAERFQGTFKEVPYPNELKETFDQALDTQSLSIDKYNKLLEKIGEGIFPFKSLVNKEAHFQGILNGVFSYYSDLKLQESPETRALVLTEFQTGRGERIDMLVHGIKFVAQGGNAEEYTPIGLELKTSRQGKGAQALLKEANDQINEEYKEGVTYKTLTDGDEVKFIGVVFDKGSNDPRKLILTSRTNKEGFIPLKVVHSSHTLLPHLRQCSKRESSSPEYPPSKKSRRERSVNVACMDSFDEEKITEEEKEQRIKELFNADKVAERVKNIEFYDQLFKVSQKISEGEIIDKNVEEAFIARIKDIDLDSIDSEIRDIVKEMKDNIENKEEVKNILRRSGVAEKIGKVAEGAGLAFTAFLVGKHIANGDIKGLGYDALNLWVMPKIGEKISGKILGLGEKLDSQMLKGFAPVMGRAIGNFAAFLGLAESIKARQNATDPADIKIADLNIATNSIFIAADVPAVITETMSVAGLETGVVGEFAGPVGAAVSVAVIVISQFVEAGLEVEKLEEQMNLTDQEKHDLYWDLFLGKKVPHYIEDNMEIQEIYKQYISKIVDKFKNDYSRIAISLPPVSVKKIEYATNNQLRQKKRGIVDDIDSQMKHLFDACRIRTKVIDRKFDFNFTAAVSSSNTGYTDHYSRIVPHSLENYNIVCGSRGDNIKEQEVSRETWHKLPSEALCDDSSPHKGEVLSTVKEKWSLQEYPPHCQNVVVYKNESLHKYKTDMYYMKSLYTDIHISEEDSLNLIFWGTHVSISDSSKKGSDKVENRYYFMSPLESCDVQKSGSNFFYIQDDRLSCNLGINGQKNIVVVKGDFIDSKNIHSVIGSNEANHIEVSRAGYVDGKGGNDVITTKNFTTIKGYFGDSIHGKGLVLLPINFNDIDNITHVNNITTIYNKSGAFISVDKQTSVKTADGLFVTPTKVEANTGRVTNLQITKLDDKLDNLQKIDNSNFNITKQLLSANYHSTIGGSSNHIFYPDKEHHNFYWEAPSNTSHLYLFDNRNANITIAQANGILDFSQLNCTLDDILFIENKKGEIKINKNGLNVTLLPDYKDVTVTFDGQEYYTLQGGELERDYCSHSLKIDGRFSVNGTDLLNHHNCFTFDSEKVLFLKLNNNLLLLSDRGALSISGYYSSVHKNWDLSIGLNNRVMEPEEFGERADEFSSFRYYKSDEQGLQIYHNQPINKNDIGLVDLKDKSILDFDMKVMNDTLLLSHKNNTLVKVESWNTYQPAREVMFAFYDATVSNSKCIVSTCNSEDVILEFNKEKEQTQLDKELSDALQRSDFGKVKDLVIRGANINAKDSGGNTLLHNAAREDRLDAVKCLIDNGANINVKNNRNLTPLQVVGSNSNVERVLRQAHLDEELLLTVKSEESLKTINNLIIKGINGGEDRHGAYYFAWVGDLDTVKFIIQNEGGVNVTDKYGCTLLHWAALKGHSDIARFLIDKGANVSAKDILGRTPTHFAVINNHVDIIEFLLKQGASVNEADRNGWTSLHYAAGFDQLDSVRFLIEKGADFNTADKDGYTPLESACMLGQLDIVKYLVGERKADFNIEDKDGYTPLESACMSGQLDIVKYLVEEKEKKGKIDFSIKGKHGHTLLHIASESGQLNILKYLIEVKKADLNVQDKDGYTPLESACVSGQLNVVKYLIEKSKVDSNVKNKSGSTLLHLAALNGKLNMVRYLIEERKDDFYTAYKDGYTLLESACMSGHLDIVKYLITKKEKEGRIDFSIKGIRGHTLLHIASENGQLNILEYLIEVKKADLNVEDQYGHTPLEAACMSGQLNVVKYLIEKSKVDSNVKNKSGSTLLHLAALNGKLNMVRYLIEERNADLNVQDKDGYTPLHYAAGLANLAVVEKLVEKGADFNAQSFTERRTPLHEAAYYNKIDIVKFLVSAGASVNIQDKHGITPLGIAKASERNDVVKYLEKIDAGHLIGARAIHFAAEENNVEAIQYLLDTKRERLDERDNNGLTPLHYAAILGNLAAVKKLVEEGADFDAQYFTERRTPLHEAAYCNKIDIVKFLVSAGADVNIQDKHGITPLGIAAAAGNYGIVEYLQQEGSVDSKIPNTVEKPLQRKHRHHHGDHDYHHIHLSRKPLSIEQPEVVASSGTRPSSWINDLFNWVTSSIDGIWGSKPALPKETSSTPKPISQVNAQTDINSTILLLDMIVRRITGQKYISTVDQSISTLEAQGYALNITKGFKKVVEQAGLKSGLSMHRLNIDYIEIQKEITRKIMSGEFNEISGVLKSYVEKGCPGKEAGKLSPKKFDKFIAQLNKGLLNQSIDHNGDGRLEVNGAKQMSLEPQSYLSNASVQGHLTQNKVKLIS